MKLLEILDVINKITMDKGLSQPFICGGTPRDKILNNIKNLNDIDITTGNSDIHLLAQECSIAFKNKANLVKMPDGHSSLYIGNLKIDFSSNFIVPNIDKIVGHKMLDIHKELFSRDFTCNSLLMSIDLLSIYDPLRKGIDAINKKEIDTCLDPDITLFIDPNRIIRAIYLSSKLDFKISDRVKDYIINNKQLLSNVKTEYLIAKINKSIEFNKEKTLSTIKELQLNDLLSYNYSYFKQSID
jgi:tRNA nucleotidyltransferase/poly(A) polymerase